MTDHRFNAYLDFYESISPQSVQTIKDLCTADVHFKDPFNDVNTANAYQKVLKHMYQQVDAPSFTILEKAVTGDICYLKWNFSFSRNGKRNAFVGMSEVTVNAEGKVISHVDYWDSGEHIYSRIPVLGALIRFVRGKLSAV